MQVEGSLKQMEMQKKFSFNKENQIYYMAFNNGKEAKEHVRVN